MLLDSSSRLPVPYSVRSHSNKYCNGWPQVKKPPLYHSSQFSSEVRFNVAPRSKIAWFKRPFYLRLKHKIRNNIVLWLRVSWSSGQGSSIPWRTVKETHNHSWVRHPEYHKRYGFRFEFGITPPTVLQVRNPISRSSYEALLPYLVW